MIYRHTRVCHSANGPRAEKGSRKLANKSAWRGGAPRVVGITRRLPIACIIPYNNNNNRGTLHRTSDLCRPIVRGKKSPRRGPPSVKRPGPAAVFSRRYIIGRYYYIQIYAYAAYVYRYL